MDLDLGPCAFPSGLGFRQCGAAWDEVRAPQRRRTKRTTEREAEHFAGDVPCCESL